MSLLSPTRDALEPLRQRCIPVRQDHAKQDVRRISGNETIIHENNDQRSLSTPCVYDFGSLHGDVAIIYTLRTKKILEDVRISLIELNCLVFCCFCWVFFSYPTSHGVMVQLFFKDF